LHLGLLDQGRHLEDVEGIRCWWKRAPRDAAWMRAKRTGGGEGTLGTEQKKKGDKEVTSGWAYEGYHAY